MRPMSRVLTMTCAVLLLAGTGLAKPPTADDLPRFQDVLEAIQKALVEAKEAEREARRDKDREFLADYAAERVGGADNHKRIVNLIGNRKIERTKAGIRAEAAEIVKKRWPRNRQASLRDRVDLSKLLIPFLKVSRRDDRGSELAIGILESMWGRTNGYKMDAKPRTKRDAVKAWEKYIKAFR